MTINADGYRTQGVHYHSHILWSGIEGISRTKLAVMLWFGRNHPSVPFAAFNSPAQIDSFEADVKTWIGASQ